MHVTNLIYMLNIVQSQASHSPDVLQRQGCKKQADISNLISHIVVPENVASDDPGLLCLADVLDAPRKYGIAVVNAAILS